MTMSIWLGLFTENEFHLSLNISHLVMACRLQLDAVGRQVFHLNRMYCLSELQIIFTLYSSIKNVSKPPKKNLYEGNNCFEYIKGTIWVPESSHLNA